MKSFFANLLIFLILIVNSSHAENNKDLYEKLDSFGDVFDLIQKNYVEDVEDEKVIEFAINGMLQALDPHSGYMNTDQYIEMQEETEGEFGGLGIEVSMENGFIKIITPIDDTPAAKAGVMPGDYITHINGESIQGQSLQESVEKLRGLVGTSVEISIARAGEDEVLIKSIKRAIITVQAVKFRREDNVGYIRLISFSEQAGKGIKKAIKDLQKEIGEKNISGFILDLRNNPGGLLGQSIDVTNHFLSSGEIVSTKGRDKRNIARFDASKGDLTNGKPLVILINEGSASASEIVAGALQDHKRAIILGAQSYGKGSVQTIFPLNDRSAIRMTTALYYTPSGDSIHKVGVTPDIEVKSDFSNENEIDKQLEYALDLLDEKTTIN
ncbi:MAG: S41 family peptidase [Candidatus Pelagibacterales bacterium]|jgi:carboxyl-terminal processing protease|tara:strand:- start:1568 stop:2716 length:1149 start_codon:yes stop_codon:yes gene_type:complete